MIKVLNLYASLGGNRYKWDEVANIHVTAVERDAELARLYQDRFPLDKVIVGDAHQYLLEHFKEFDFIWSSPPCPTHSRARDWNTKLKPVYPDMSLYQEVVLLDNKYDGFYCVENVIPYYDPLIPAKKRGRHLYWTNFKLPNVLSFRRHPQMGSDADNEVSKLQLFHAMDISGYKGVQRRDKIMRNMVDYEAGRTILQTAIDIIKGKDFNQIGLFAKL